MSSEIVVFLNRLSDFLFVLARKVLRDHGLMRRLGIQKELIND